MGMKSTPARRNITTPATTLFAGRRKRSTPRRMQKWNKAKSSTAHTAIIRKPSTAVPPDALASVSPGEEKK